ncbi:MAG: methyl-accepting chemotaxis protein [Treponema sp.]|nr:methyl-accepting chemotaxis protein [Treponema sp.]MDY5838601.1 methyl-accepting chemotaxis protein [Treponema sp.]
MPEKKKSKLSSVSTILITAVSAGFLAFSVVLFVLISRYLSSGLESYFQGDLDEYSEVVVEEVKAQRKGLVNAQSKLADSFESMFENSGSFSVSYMNTEIDLTKRNLGIQGLAVVDVNGRQVSSKNYGDASNDSDIVQKALKGDAAEKIVKEGQNVVVVRAVPFKIGGKIAGVVFGKETLTSQEFAEKMKKYTMCDFTIFDGEKRAYTTLAGMRGSVIADINPIRTAESGKKYEGKAVINGVRYVVCYFPLKAEDGKFLTTLWLGKPLVVIDHVFSAIFKPLIAVMIVIVVLFFAVLVSVIIFKVIKPLKRVDAAVNNLASGDADLAQRIEVHGNDEFAEISTGINTFIEMLHKIVSELNSAQKELTAIGIDLGTNSQESASATAEIMANIAGVRKQSESQSEAVSNTTTILGHSAENVNNLENLVEAQAAGITESSAAIEQMLGNISSVTSSVRKMADSFKELGITVSDGKTKLANVDGKVNEIAEQSKMLIQANTIIAQIASETNLLAMNAAIEAAHAGKAGEGFSVVANEIRKLAETSSAQSKNINTELKEISSSIKDVVSLSKDSQVAFGQIVTHLDSTDVIIREIDNAMSEQENASRQIFSALSDMRNQSIEVNEMSHQVKDNIVAVTKDMDTVSQISSIILGSMDEMTAGAQQISTATQGVSDLAASTKENIDVMDSKLKLFRV